MIECDFEPPTLPREHEGHIGVRFGDGGQGYSVTFNGQRVPDSHVREASAGENGWMLVYLPVGGEKIVCPCGRHMVQAVLRGRVGVSREVAAA